MAKIYDTIKEMARTATILYVIGGSALINATKTGHQSADIATGRSQPTQIEKKLVNYFINSNWGK